MIDLTEAEQDRHYEIEQFFGANRKKCVEAMLKIAMDYLGTEVLVTKKDEINLEAMIDDLIADTCYSQQEHLRSETPARIDGEYVNRWAQGQRAISKSWALDCVLEGLKP